MKRVALLCIITFVFVSCTNGKRGTRTDTITSGIAGFSCDDCFARIIQEEADVFEALNKEAFLFPQYTNEVEAVNLLLKDSVRMAILARDLSDAEKEGIKARNPQLVPRTQKLAVDGVALIINENNSDSLISVPSLQKIMSGEITTWKELNPKSKLDKIIVVFDNKNSSTVRFIKDSICVDKPLSEDLNAQNNNQEVLDYVSRTPGAMGLIGVNWVSNPKDTTNLTFTSKIRVMMVSREHPATLDNSCQPLPAYLALGDYPLTRNMYAVLTDYSGTLLAGFYNFMCGDKGQRIILKAGLVPTTRPIRLIQVNDSF